LSEYVLPFANQPRREARVSGEDKKEPDTKEPGSEKPAEADATSAWTGLLKEAAKTLMPVLLTGASLLGFVAFAGAVIVWTRFFAIEVPPDQAVKAVPREELVATGSSLLLLFGFFGVLAVLATYLVDRGGRATPGMSRILLAVVALEGVTAIVIADDKMKLVAIGTLLLLVAVAFAATFFEGLARYEDKLPDREHECEDPVRGVGLLHTADGGLRVCRIDLIVPSVLAAIGVCLASVLGFTDPPGWVRGGIYVIAIAVALVFAIAFLDLFKLLRASRRKERAAVEKRKEKEKKKALKLEEERKKEKADEKAREERPLARFCARIAKCRPGKDQPESRDLKLGKLERKRKLEEERLRRPRPHRLAMAPPGMVLFGLLAVAAVVAPWWILGHWWPAVSTGVALVLCAGLWRIAVRPKPNFMWYGFAVFLSVPLFGTSTLMARNIEDPQVQPVALIRSSDGPDEAIQGIYVTEGDDRIYFANVATEGCTNELTPHSGRLLWVPKKDVVAMSIGPLQGISDVGKSALEMAYTLTPSVETPAAGAVSLTVSEKKSKKLEKAEEARELKEVETQAPSVGDQRLENPGPAVRPNFGTGLSLVPEVASPGAVVELRLSVPNEDVNGFGAEPHGHTLRLNGVPLTPIREATPYADRAEYVKTEGGVLLSLDKQGVYGLSEEEGRPYPLGEGSTYGKARYVKLEDSRATVIDGDLPDHPEYLRVVSGKAGAELAGAESVVVEHGKPEALEPGFLRQAWSKDRIRFRVPEAASSGVVTVECDQLAGSPLLRVPSRPTARIALRMNENSTGIALDSSSSRGEDGEKISRRWTVEGLGRGHRKEIATRFPPRLGAYLVKLTVTDEAGNTDTAELRLLRLPTSLFEFKGHPMHREEIKAAAKALDEAVQARPPKAIELDGHTDHAGSPAMNMKLAFERDDHVVENLLREPKTLPPGELPIPVRELAYGRTCPIDPRIGSRPRNRRVDVFVLDEGVTVKPPKGCVPGRLKKTMWYPRLSTDAKALSGGIAAPSQP
jgi:flagellar motor protein MotB